ncbi:MAG: hemerythrin domain-containing protein [Actinomycetota bacterium]|nr:hemerythrin domain-containing protein [Actinomycetota bacterium]
MPQSALTLLQEDHDKMKKIMSDIDSTTERGLKTREELFTTMKEALNVHERVEEEIFYPALREHKKAKEIVMEGYEEHRAVDMLLGELESVPFDDESWSAKFTVIKENIEHHIKEEENEMFDKARQIFDRAELQELGGAMAARKEKAQATY